MATLRFLTAGIGRRQARLRFIAADRLCCLETFGEQKDERGIDIVDRVPEFPKTRQCFILGHDCPSLLLRQARKPAACAAAACRPLRGGRGLKRCVL